MTTMAVQRFVSRTVGDVSSRTVRIVVGLVASFLLLASIGVWYLYEAEQVLIFELAYVLLLLIGFALIADRLLVQ